MGKKKYKAKYKYTKHEFMSICCNKCRICYEGTSPDLCYSDLYAIQPKKFLKTIFRNLTRVTGRDWLYTDLEKFFIKVFCSTNICKNYKFSKKCNKLPICLNKFKYQLAGSYNIGNLITKKKQQQYVVQAYPTFFTNNNKAFSEEIKRILADESNNTKSNTIERCTN